MVKMELTADELEFVRMAVSYAKANIDEFEEAFELDINEDYVDDLCRKIEYAKTH